MAKTLYISGSDYSGKTSIALGLALIFKEQGKKVTYFKPIGQPAKELRNGVVDEDVVMMKNVLDLKHDLDTISPIQIRYDYVSQLIREDPKKLEKKVLDSYYKISKDADLVIAEASNLPETLNFLNLASPDVARLIDGGILLVTKGYSEGVLDYNILHKEFFCRKGCKIVGSVINHVPEILVNRMEKVFKPLLRKHGMPCYGVIHEKESMGAPRVKELAKELGAAVLTGEEFLDRTIENLFVGAMTPDSALKFFRQSVNHAVITGGDRADIAMAALETKTAALIFTGGMRPSQIVISAAHERGVPVLEVMDDTFNAVRKVEDLMGRIRPSDKQRIELAQRAVLEHVEYSRLYKDLEKL
ncbi:MAG: phosphotransacetylase family protein [Candidatus Ranarchaeia archaeon]